MDPSPISKDLSTLHMLADYKTGYIDIDKEGHITSNYAEGWGASFWRTGRYAAGFSGNSNDLLKLESVFLRVFLATRNGGDGEELIGKALTGLVNLKAFYQGKDKEYKDQVVGNIDKVISAAKGILALNYPTPHEKDGISDDSSTIPNAHANKPGMGPKDLGRLASLEASTIGSGAELITDGFDYYMNKLDLFLESNKANLSDKQKALLAQMKNSLVFGMDFHKAYPKDLSALVSAKYPDLVAVKAMPLLKKEVFDRFFQCFESVNPPARDSVEVVLPCGYRAITEEGAQEHASPVGFRWDSKLNGYIMTQYNAGGAALGDWHIHTDLHNWRFHLANKGVPLMAQGQTVVSYGPYTRAEIEEKLPKITKVGGFAYQGLKVAEEELRGIYDANKRLPQTTPDRRLQLVGNCATRNVLEWMVDMCQRAGEVELINEFICFGQTRDKWSSPALELAEPLNIKTNPSK